MRRIFFLLSFLLSFCFLKAQYTFIVTPVPAESLAKAGVQIVREYYRDGKMQKDSLMQEFKVDNRGLPYYHLFRVSHKNTQWGIRKIFINSDSTEKHYEGYGWDGKTEKLFTERIEVFKPRPSGRGNDKSGNDVGLYVIIQRDFSSGQHQIDTLSPEPEKTNRVFWSIFNGDTTKEIRDHRKGNTKIYYWKEKKNGIWEERERSVTTYKKDGGFDTYHQYKEGKLFNSYTAKDLEKKDLEDRNGLEHENNNPLPSDDREKIQTKYTDTPYSKDPILKDSSFPGAYTWVDYFEFGDSKKIYLTEVYDPKGLLVLKWLRNSEERYTYKYIYRNPKKKN